jgi:hypothetical protein
MNVLKHLYMFPRSVNSYFQGVICSKTLFFILFCPQFQLFSGYERLSFINPNLYSQHMTAGRLNVAVAHKMFCTRAAAVDDIVVVGQLGHAVHPLLHQTDSHLSEQSVEDWKCKVRLQRKSIVRFADPFKK